MADLIRSANELFGEVPMPLFSCFDLRHRIGSASAQPDPLAALQLNIGQSRTEGVSDPELAELLRPHRLGEWALSSAAINRLVLDVLRDRPRIVLEFGCGSSTVALAWALRKCWGSTPAPMVFSIEQSAEFLLQTEQQLEAAGLSSVVRLLHAPLTDQTIDRMQTRCYALGSDILPRFLGGRCPEWVVIDGPAADHGGRVGTLPLVGEHLAPGARVYLDDALRDGELIIADWWGRLGYLDVEGILWIGKGLLIGRAPGRAASHSPSAHAYLAALLGTTTFRLPGIAQPAEIDLGRPADKLVRPRTMTSAIPAAAQVMVPAQASNGRVCVFINTYYTGFLSAHYQRHPELAKATYEEQHHSLIGAGFGDSDFYSEGLKAAGWRAHDLIVNCAPLQAAWSRNRRTAADIRGLAIAIEQVRALSPDVLYLHDLNLATPEFLDQIRPYASLIVGQIASPIPEQADLSRLDILVSSFPHFVDAFRRDGHTAYYQPLAFEPRILGRLGEPVREHRVSFVGGLSPAHRDRQQFVAALATHLPLECWGYGTQALTQGGVDAKRLHGECWGMEMFGVLRRSLVTVNHHIDVAKNAANNMRLFEATGCGALLITDYKDNLNDLFEIGTEVLAYRSIEECVDLVSYCLSHPEEAAAIARRGQQRTLTHHTYRLRMEQTAEWLERHLRVRRHSGGRQAVDPSRVSYGKRAVSLAEIPPQLAVAWESPDIPARQRALVDEELRLMWTGRVPTIFQVMAQALRPYVRAEVPVLEVGCASGYYYEVLEYLLNVRLTYTGVDLSAAMVAMARDCYPRATFGVANGAGLPFDDGSFPIVVSSCVLLHVLDYPVHIREASRVSSDVVVLHRTPVCRSQSTQYFRKFAYGVETQELRFQESELLDLAQTGGLQLREAIEFERHPDADEFEVTYVFRKRSDEF
ncbi:hypothetical protein YTPLAS18_27080 [Nitrospira sp.]|nr:hypothetical protein YTPLAS18_27080 [Nitrospira sp.]